MESYKYFFTLALTLTAGITAITLFRKVRLRSEERVAQPRPNVVIFFADDIGWGDFGANWDQYKSVTLNLNKLADNGIRFTDFHVGASVCGPSRAALLTGRLGLRTGLVSNFKPGSLGGLPLNETTLAEALKTVGYRTGMIGKWHLGQTDKYQPNSRGFDFYYGLPYSNDMGCVDVAVFNRPPAHPCPKNMEGEYRLSAVPLYENKNIVEQPVDLINLGDHYASKAEKFIAESSLGNDPFFLYVAFAHMHVPHAHAPRFSNSTDQNSVYADTLHEMDDVIGRIVTTLEKFGYTDDTMIWFTGDNGPWGNPGPFLGSWLTTTYGGGSTGKTSTWEAGHREPAVAVWPNHFQAGRVSDALVSSMDIFPTVLSYAGVQMPPNRRFDGLNIADLLEGRSTNAHDVLYHPNSGLTHPDGEIDTIRMGPYKIFWKTGGNTGCCRSCDGKIAPQVSHNPPIIFDVMKDPSESSQITAETDPNYHDILRQAEDLRMQIVSDIKADNTSVADYSTGPKGYPCCDATKPLCRCQRDREHFMKFDQNF